MFFCCMGFIEILPYFLLVSVPVLGAFCGIETINRLAVVLMLHAAVVECIPKNMLRIGSVLNLLLFVLLLYLPVSLTPWPVIWLFEMVLWVSNPVFMLSEVILVQNFVMRKSQLAVDQIEENNDSEFSFKAAILIFSSLCYALAASIAYEIYLNATGNQLICLAVTVSIIIAIHNMMLMAHEGIISDCAFCSLVSISVVYVMMIETQQITSPLPEPPVWKTASYARSSVASIAYWVVKTNSANAEKSIRYLQRIFSSFFLGLLAVRLYSILYIVNRVTRNFFTEKEDDECCDMQTVLDDLEESHTYPWRSPLLLKISLIFMLCQFTTHFLSELSGRHPLWPAGNEGVWLVQLMLSRIAQVVVVNAFYMWRLYRAEEWTWNPWLTP